MPAMPPTLVPPRVRPRHLRAAPMLRLRSAVVAATLVLAGFTLAACAGPKDNEFPPICPGLKLVPDAADLTRFDGKGVDVTNLVDRSRITEVPAQCVDDKKGTVHATLHVVADIERGPASPATPAPVGYFVALMENDKVLNEQDFALAATFASNVDHTTVKGDDIELLLPVSKTKSAAAYHIFVGFRLSPAELAYNRAHPAP